MKFNNENRICEQYSTDYVRRGRKKGYKAEINYSPNGLSMSKSEPFYFLIEDTKSDYYYNSLWDKKKYKTEEDCMMACEKWIDQH